MMLEAIGQQGQDRTFFPTFVQFMGSSFFLSQQNEDSALICLHDERNLMLKYLIFFFSNLVCVELCDAC